MKIYIGLGNPKVTSITSRLHQRRVGNFRIMNYPFETPGVWEASPLDWISVLNFTIWALIYHATPGLLKVKKDGSILTLVSLPSQLSFPSIKSNL